MIQKLARMVSGLYGYDLCQSKRADNLSRGAAADGDPSSKIGQHEHTEHAIDPRKKVVRSPERRDDYVRDCCEVEDEERVAKPVRPWGVTLIQFAKCVELVVHPLTARVVKTLHWVRYRASEPQASPYRSLATLSAERLVVVSGNRETSMPPCGAVSAGIEKGSGGAGPEAETSLPRQSADEKVRCGGPEP
jgi:hypothetical protein